MACISCGRGFHTECFNDPCCCSQDIQIPQAGFTDVIEVKRGRTPKDDLDITVSAGRKRAAVAYKVDPEAFCEWRLKADCGGGAIPILGCLDGKQKHRHHGPVKRTSRNERENIHLICVHCHNNWHAKNDPLYGKAKGDEDDLGFELKLHAPRDMTTDEMFIVATGKRVKDEPAA